MSISNITNNAEIKKSVAVWLINPATGKVLLQKRNESESRPFVCQPTWNGKFESGEDTMTALKREAEEELGSVFYTTFDFTKLVLFGSDEYSFDGKNFTSYNFWGTITNEQLKSVVLHESAEPQFIAVGVEDLPKVKSNDDKTADPKKDVVLFEDQYQALKKLFSLKEVIEITS
jgi:8-oxo-dGTP pyrophosphatase MutT (NUDIX family)